MSHHTTSSTDDERTVSEGDSVIFTGSGERTEGEVTKKYDDGSFMVEWMSNGEERGQIFRPKVFDRSAFVEHEPKEEQTA
jgi:hypothetical protein